MIAATDTLDDNIFAAAPQLRVISRVGTGLDSIDLKAAEHRGIQIFRTADAPAEAVAELTFGLILNVFRHVSEADRAFRLGTWKSLMGNLLYGKTIGLVGLGRVGRRLVELLTPLNVKVLALELYPDKNFVRKHRIQLVSLPKLLRSSDIVSMHLTLNEKTREMMGDKEFGQMKLGSVFINTARGELIKENALVAALASGRIKGAGLDVFSKEPYNGPFLQCPNTVLTCHMGTYAEETRNLMEIEAAKNVIVGLRKRRP